MDGVTKIMGKRYRSTFDTSDVSDALTPTGYTARQNVSMQEVEQRRVAESPRWSLARKLNSVRGEYVRNTDSREELESLGFEVLREADDLFYEVQPPQGWDKETQGYWTSVVDAQGTERLSQFYKGAFYDREAFINIKMNED